MNVDLYFIAERYIGTDEVEGKLANPVIMAMLTKDNAWPDDDSVPWCSGAMNWWAWHLRLPRSKSLRARSWLQVGRSVDIYNAKVGYDVVILKRGGGDQPGPEVINAPGHVGLFAGLEGDRVLILGGNQSDQVNVSGYPARRILGVRRLHDD